MTTPRPDSRLGSDLGPYRIERVLGRGGMGVVYLAEQRELGRKVALKLLPDELAHDADFRARFLRESKLAASIDHANIIPIYEAGEAAGTYYLAMRYVEGTDLDDRLKAGPLDPGLTADLLAQVAGALDAAHAAGLVHRDVKPANLLLADEGGAVPHVYLTDFGLTKKRASQTGGLTRAGSTLGTLEYMAPEQVEGGDVDAPADAYALACVAFQCLTGHVPFERDSDVAVAMAHLRDAPPSAVALRPELPAGVDAVLARGMAKDPLVRYETCAALIADLRAALSGALIASPTRLPSPTSRRPLAIAGVLGLGLVAIAGLVLAPGGLDGSASGSPSPSGSVVGVDFQPITPENGADLRQAAVHVSDNGSPGPISITDEVLYTGLDSSLVAYAVDCLERAPCSPRWSAELDGRLREAPRVWDGTVYAGAGPSAGGGAAGSLFAFPASCAEVGGICPSTWRGTGGDLVRGAPLFIDDGGPRRLVALSEDGLRLYDGRCDAAGGVCTPAASHLRPRRDMTAAGLGAFIYAGTRAQGDGQGRVLAYVENCNASNCPVDWEWAGQGDVTAIEVDDDDLIVGVGGDAPRSRDVYALSEGACTPDACDAKWTADVDGDVLDVVITARSVIVLATGGVTAYSRFCINSCDPQAPLWTYSSPSALDGLLAGAGEMLYAGSLDGSLVALSQTCEPRCTPIWTGSVGSVVPEVHIAADERHLVAAGPSGLHVFGVGEGDAGPPADASSAPVAAPTETLAPDPSLFPNTAEATLLEMLPPELRATCERGRGQGDAIEAGFTGQVIETYRGSARTPVYGPLYAQTPSSSVACRPADRVAPIYFQWFSESTPEGEAVADALIGKVAGKLNLSDGDCATSAPALARWSSTSASGRVACAPDPTGKVWLYWTFAGGRALGFAAAEEDAYPALYDWFDRLASFLP